jgi:TolA-binding protein
MATTCECGSVVKNLQQHIKTEKHRNWIIKQGGSVSSQSKHTCECGSVVTRLAPHYKTKKHLEWVERQTRENIPYEELLRARDQRIKELIDREQRTHEFNVELERLRSEERAKKLREDIRKRDEERERQRERQRVKERAKEREERANQRKKEREKHRQKEKIKLLSQSSNPFVILGVLSTSTKSQIRKAYYSLAKIHHPDKGGNPEFFKQVSNAYASIK